MDNRKLSKQLQMKIIECQDLISQPHPSQAEYKNRIQELETEIDELKQLIKSFETKIFKGFDKNSANELLEKLSLMFLNKNIDPNFFSERQKTLIRSLFGDYATTTYKEKIKELNMTISKLQRDNFNLSKFAKNQHDQIVETIPQPNTPVTQINRSGKPPFKPHNFSQSSNYQKDPLGNTQMLFSKNDLFDDKLNLLEQMAEVDKYLNDDANADSGESLFHFNSTSTSKLKYELFRGTDEDLTSELHDFEFGSQKGSGKENIYEAYFM